MVESSSKDNPAVALRRIATFSALDDRTLRRFASGCRVLPVKAGRRVFMQGQPADRFFVILQGQVKIFKLSPRGQEQVLHLYGAGETFGEAAMWAGGRYPAHAEAITAARLLVVTRRQITEAVAADVELAMAMLAGLSGKLQEFARLIERLSLKEVPARLAAALLEQAAASGGDRFHLRQTKRGLAAELGTVAESLSRAFARLKSEGLIDVKGSQVVILDPEGLKSAAEGE